MGGPNLDKRPKYFVGMERYTTIQPYQHGRELIASISLSLYDVSREQTSIVVITS